MTDSAQTHGARARKATLGSFLHPRSIAVVGASDVEGKVGHTVMLNLAAAGFAGEIYPVNSGRERVMDRKSYPSVSSLPEKPELVIIATPARTVPAIVDDCAARDVPAVLILSAGFRETGVDGMLLEEQVRTRAQAAVMRVIGPNCLGVMSPRSQLNATFASVMALSGHVAFLSQSGALCTAVLDWSLTEKVGFSALVSLGSMVDVGWADVIRYFGEDSATKCIVMYMETVGEPRTFIAAAREVALKKPIVVIKAGRSEAAARATMSHTGSLAGSDAVLDAAFRRCGVLRVDRIADVFYMADVLGKQRRPDGPRLTIVTNAGGPGVLATDALMDCGGTLAELSQSTQDELNRLLPAHWSHGNPIDVLGDASAKRYSDAIEIAIRDPGTDGLLAIVTPQGITQPADIARSLIGYGQGGKPLLASFMGGKGMQEAENILNSGGIPTFPYPDSAARIFEYMWQYSRNLRSLYETPVLDEEGSGPIPPFARELIDGALRKGRTILSEFESKQILQAYRIPVVDTVVAVQEDQAVDAAVRLGFPVALKLHSETITHKSDVGGVLLNIATEGAVREAFRSIRKSVEEKAGAGHFQGVAVQHMLRRGYELILGSSVDAQFGPVILFGLGGELVEVFHDRALALPPLNTTLAKRLMERTKIYAALQGVRGRKPVDLGLLERILVRLSRLIVEQPRISEIDINPLLVSEHEICALDARIILNPPSVPDAQLPCTAIRPYPDHYSGCWVSHTGDRLRIRPIRPEDELQMVAFHRALSDRSVHLRYLAGISYAQRTAHDRLTRVCGIDYDREMAFVAEVLDDGPKRGTIAGIGRLVRDAENNKAEFALVVADEFQGRGLGAELLRRLVQVGRDQKLDAIEGWIAPSNTAMQNISRKLGFEVRMNLSEELVQATLSLT
jgi:acetyltransferase